jgi:DNA-binding CsgD family transcriptional regulator
VLVGRESEKRLIDDVIAAARAGRSSVVGLEGEMGSGKSALLDHAAASADGLTVLRVRGIQSEAQIPFAALYELLRPTLGRLDQLPAPRREALEGALALRPARPQDRFAVGAATLGLLTAVAEDAPVLVLVDDAHWVDGSSADALRFAFRRLLADPVGVVLAVREDEPSLLDGTDLRVRRLEGLDRASAAELARRHATEGSALGEDVLDRLHRGTGGNPLALIELADDPGRLGETGVLDPPLPVVTSVGRVYLERCAGLPERTRDALLLAAACNTTTVALLDQAAGRVGLSFDDLIPAEVAGLVSLTGDGVEFRHPLVRSAVYAGAGVDRRRRMHRALADALPDADADRRAWHLGLAAAGPDDAACSALEQAAARARDRSAYGVASDGFARAATLAPDIDRRGALLLAAADSAWLGGSAERARALIEEARRHPGSGATSVGVEHLRGHIATRSGPVGVGLQILLDGAELAAADDPDRAVVMLAEAVNAAFYAGDGTAVQRAAARLPPLLERLTKRRAQFFGVMAEGMAKVFRGDDLAGGAALLRRGVELVVESGELAEDPRLLAWAAMGPIWLRTSDARPDLVGRALTIARRQSAVGTLPFLLVHIGVDGVAADRWTEAEAAFHEAIDLARETGQRTDLAFGLARLALLEARQGKEEPGRAHALEAQSLAAEVDSGLSEIWAVTALAEVELAAGRVDAAADRFEALETELQARQIGDVDLSPQPELVELDLRRGHRDRAVERLEAVERKATAKGQPWALARVARCRGLLAEDDGCARHFDEALALHDRTPDVFEAARTRLAYGGRLRRARHRVLARDQLRAALAVFERLDASPWADMAGDELAASGETARRRDPSTRLQLTPRELQVALLLAGGDTTREAATTLFLSPKTVEYHLGSVYRKLGINSREELAATLHDVTPDPAG